MHKEFEKILEFFPGKLDDTYYLKVMLAYYKKASLSWNLDKFTTHLFILNDDRKIIAFIFKIKDSGYVVIPVNKTKKFIKYLKSGDLKDLDENLLFYLIKETKEVFERKKEFYENEKKLDPNFDNYLIDYDSFFDLKKYLK